MEYEPVLVPYEYQEYPATANPDDAGDFSGATEGDR